MDAIADSGKAITKVQELVYEMKVGEVMTTGIITVSPDKLMCDLREVLRDKRISGVPVVLEGKLLGMVSIEDFIKCMADGLIQSRISDRMSRGVCTLYDDEPLVKAVEEFDRKGYGRFPVINRQTGCLVGVITKGDIIRGLLKKIEVEYHAEEIHHYRASHIFEDIIADRTTLIFQYDVEALDFSRAGGASSGLKQTLRRMGIAPPDVRRATIAAYEAEMNVVVFTSGGTMTAKVSPNEIRIEVVDSGPGIEDVQKALQPGFSTAPDWVRSLGFGAGMGLNNIQHCSDSMTLESEMGKGTCLEFCIKLGGKANHEN